MGFQTREQLPKEVTEIVNPSMYLSFFHSHLNSHFLIQIKSIEERLQRDLIDQAPEPSLTKC